MKKKEYDTETEDFCIYCENATHIVGSNTCVCKIKGIVKADGKCSKFKADMLKINPSKPTFFGKM